MIRGCAEMNHIGMIIKTYRTKLGMSRNRLAENVCSEKYIYLYRKRRT